MIPVDRTSNHTPSSPCIETTKQCEERYRLNSLDRTTSLKLKVMDDHQCDSLPDHCKTNVIINKLGSSPVLDDNVYSEVHIGDGSCLLHDKSLAKLEQLLPNHFKRVHKSFIANLSKIKSISRDGNSTEICFVSEQRIPVSRSKAKELNELLI